jgi:prophage regulatory protein
MSDRIIRRPEVERMTGLSRSTIYDWMARKTFPAPVRLGKRTIGWRISDVDAWIAERELRQRV